MFRQSDRYSASFVYLLMCGAKAFAGALVLTILAIYYVTAVEMNPFQLVLAGTVFELAILLCEVPTGVLADTFSRRLSVIVGTLIIGASLTLEGLVPLFAAVLIAEVIGGVGETFLSGATEAWLADEVGEEQVGPVYLRGAQVGRIAGLVGIPASVGLASLQLNLPIVVGGALYLALGLFLILAMPERGFRPAPPEQRASWGAALGTLRAGVRVVRGSALLLALLAVNLVAGAAGEGFDKLWEAHLLLGYTFPSLGALQPLVWFGIINAATAIAGLLVVALFQSRLETISRSSGATARALLAINALLAVSVILFGLAGSFALALAALLLKAVLGALSGPLHQTWLIQQTSPQARATVLSISSLANSLGETAGGPFVGASGARFSLRAAMVLSGALLAPVVALYARTLRQAGPGGEEPEAAAPDVAA
jgi:MFS transporter, DHA3 family, tetracycline resistance protein